MCSSFLLPHHYLSFLLFKTVYHPFVRSRNPRASFYPLSPSSLVCRFSNLPPSPPSLFSLSAGLACQVVFNPPPVHTSFLSNSFEAVYLNFAPSQNNSSLLTSIRPASFPFLFSASLFFLSFLSVAERRAAHKSFY